MRPEINPITLTVEDLIGAILPGVVWSVIFFTIKEIINLTFNGLKDVGEISTMIYPSTFDVAFSLTDDRNFVFYTGFAICSMIIGYISNAFPTNITEKLSFQICRLPYLRAVLQVGKDGIQKRRRENNGDLWYEKNGYQFPYNKIHMDPNTKYSRRLVAITNVHIKLNPQETPGHHNPFSICKRILKLNAPAFICSKIQHMEAQSRMLSSLLLASIANIVLILPAFFIRLNPSLNDKFRLNGIPFLLWLLISLFITIVIAYTFQFRRHREVESIYSYALLLEYTRKNETRRNDGL